MPYQERDPATAQTSHRPRNLPTPHRACPIDDSTDLRPARQAKNITLAVVANHFSVPLITSRGSNADINATTTWPLTTTNGSPLLDL